MVILIYISLMISDTFNSYTFNLFCMTSLDNPLFKYIVCFILGYLFYAIELLAFFIYFGSYLLVK